MKRQKQRLPKIFSNWARDPPDGRLKGVIIQHYEPIIIKVYCGAGNVDMMLEKRIDIASFSIIISVNTFLPPCFLPLRHSNISMSPQRKKEKIQAEDFARQGFEK